MVSLTHLKLPALVSAPKRSFARTVAMVIAALPFCHRNPQSKIVERPVCQMQNGFFGAFFDLNTGGLDIWFRGEKQFLAHAISTAHTNRGKRTVGDLHYARSVRFVPLKDETGNGRRMIAQCIDSKHELDFEIHLSIYENYEAVLIETICKNVSREPMVIASLEPFAVENNVTGLQVEKRNPTDIPVGSTRRIEVILPPGKSISSGHIAFHNGSNPFDLPGNSIQSVA